MNRPKLLRFRLPKRAFLRRGVGKNAPFAAALGGADPARLHTLGPANQPGEPLLGGFGSTRAAPSRAAHTPPRTPADHAAARARARRRPDRPDPDRARGQGLPRRARQPRAQRLRPQRHPDRRRDRPDQQSLLRQARRPGRPLGDRVRRRGQRRPQRDGQLRLAGRRPQHPRRHGPTPRTRWN